MERTHCEADGGMNTLPDGNEAKSVAPDADDVSEFNKIKKRVSILIGQGDWARAVSYCEKKLDSAPEDPELYFLICLLEHRIPDESAAPNSCCDILNDTNFQIALKYASPERRKQMDAIARNMAVNFYLKQCMDARGIQELSLLSESNIPLIGDENFQSAIQIAEPERKKQLTDIQRKQFDYFLGKCLEANHASDEAGLAQCEKPLVNDPDFKTALLCAMPEDQERVRGIQHAQSLVFLRKCMEKYRTFEMSDLALCNTPLKEDPCFQNALLCASPELTKELNRIVDRQSVRKQKKRNARIRIFIVFVVVFAILAAIFRLDLQIGARLGIAEAQYRLGRHYDGRRPWPTKKAKEWYLRAAKQGHSEAQFQLGKFFDNESNPDEAMIWYRKAAERNHVEAQYELGRIYYYRLDDSEEARKWFSEAANNGHAKAKSEVDHIDWIASIKGFIERRRREEERREREKERWNRSNW